MYRKFYSSEEMQWRILLIKCFEPYFLNDRKRGGKKENHLGSQFISMDLFLNAWFKKKWMRLLVQTHKSTLWNFFLAVWGCQWEQWLFIFIKGLCRLLIIFSFSFELTPNLHKALLRLILRRFFCFVFYITVQYSFSLGDGPGAARWIYRDRKSVV